MERVSEKDRERKKEERDRETVGMRKRDRES